jgi:hypothetical protein
MRNTYLELLYLLKRHTHYHKKYVIQNNGGTGYLRVGTFYASITKTFCIRNHLLLRQRIRHTAIVALAILSLATPERARAVVSSDELIEHSKECLKHFSRQERQQGIPRQLLFAVASTESGRWHEGAGVALPWPWTVNAAGKGYYFASKSEAIAAVSRFQAQGISSIDVGCMQINLKHHPEAFSNINQAFDPERNVAYAASFLKRNFTELQSWRSAIAAYHSRTASLGDGYFAQVKKNWQRAIALVGSTGQTTSPYVRVAGQQTQTRLTDVAAATNDTNTPALPDMANAADLAQPEPEAVAPQEASAQPTDKPEFKSRSTHVIKVSDAAPQQRTPDVIIVRPDAEQKAAATDRVYLANNDDTVTDFVKSRDAEREKTRQIGKTPSKPNASVAKKDGPRFIFY